LGHLGLSRDTFTYFFNVYMQTMGTYMGNVNISPLIPILDTRWRLMVSLMPQLLYPREKITWYPLNGMLGGLLT